VTHRRVQAPLRVTERADYALKSVLLLSLYDGDYVTARAIADRYAMSPRMLASVLWNLREVGLVESRPGWRGGFRLARPAATIALSGVIAAANAEAESAPAQVHPSLPPTAPARSERVVDLVDGLWKELDDRVQESLGAITVADLARGTPFPTWMSRRHQSPPAGSGRAGDATTTGSRAAPSSAAGGRPQRGDHGIAVDEGSDVIAE